MRKALPRIDDCSDCGACCTGQAALPVHMVAVGAFAEFCRPVSPLPAELASELRETVARFMRDGFPPDDSPCIWYDAATRQCSHYEHRPMLCRDGVKPGDDACRRWRRSTGIDPSARYRLVNGRTVKVVAK